MIIFYNKKTGKITGSIEGRVHNADHLNMWIGDEEENDRLIIEWEQNEKTVEFEPSEYYEGVAEILDESPGKLFSYKVDVKTKKLVKLPDRNITY